VVSGRVGRIQREGCSTVAGLGRENAHPREGRVRKGQEAEVARVGMSKSRAMWDCLSLQAWDRRRN